MKRHTLVAAMLAAAMILSALAPLGAAAATGDDAESDLTIDVDQDDVVVVTVEQNDSALENATLEVSVTDENDSYADVGNHTTDENGSVTLATPNESVEVSFSVSTENETATEIVVLEAADDGDEGDEEETGSFGALISQFVQDNQGETDGPLGIAVASFAVENNPGNAPDHAGPPSHAGPSDDAEQGPPAHAGSDGDNESDAGDDGEGPSADAGPSDDDDEQGPPADTGPDDDEEESDDGDEDTDA